MKKIFESELSTLAHESGESADSLIIFELETKDELEHAYDIDDLEDNETRIAWENWTELYNDWCPMPGSLYNRFSFRLVAPFLIVHVYTAYNV